MLTFFRQVDRRDYKYEKELQDPATGETIRYFPKRKRIARQLVSLPFALVALAALGAITTAIFGIELLISHVYAGEYKDWIVCGPAFELSSTDSATGTLADGYPGLESPDN